MDATVTIPTRDNPLLQVCDELLIGSHILARSEATTQVVPKRDPLERVRAGLDLLGEARPALELGLRRLAETRPDHGPDTVVHGDFAPYNCVVRDGLVTGVFGFDIAHPAPRLWDVG